MATNLNTSLKCHLAIIIFIRGTCGINKNKFKRLFYKNINKKSDKILKQDVKTRYFIYKGQYTINT